MSVSSSHSVHVVSSLASRPNLRVRPFLAFPARRRQAGHFCTAAAQPQDDAPTTSAPHSASEKLWNKGATLLGLSAVTGGGLLGSGFDIAGPGSVLGALGVLAAVVGIHEAGHFFAARAQNIHVTKFAIGFGPVLFKLQPAEVEYSLRAFPLGGFVSFPDDDPESPFPPDDPDLLRNRPVLDRIIVTSAGVVANIIFAYAICLVQASTVGVAQPIYSPGVRLGTINPGTVAEQAGLQRGDIVLQIADMKVAPSPSAVDDVVTKIQRSPKKRLHFVIERAGKPLELDVTPAEVPDGTGRIGVSLGANAKVERRKGSTPGEVVALAADDFRALFGTVTKGLGQFVSNFGETAQKVSGPVAILAVGSEVARTDITGLYQFAALININLAVVNILPLPALDGELVDSGLGVRVWGSLACMLVQKGYRWSNRDLG